MITVNKIGGSEITKNSELNGLSTDIKPLEVPNGSIFTEIDTSNKYMFDKENENWVKMKSQNSGGSVSDDVYSYDELVIGKWVDNKPLYRKVISTTLPDCTVNDTSAFRHIDVSSLNMADCIRCECMVISGGYSANTPFFSGDIPQKFVRTYVARINGDTDHVNILNANTGYNGQTAYLIIEYTKTTD